MSMSASHRYFDGKVAKPQAVTLILRASGLEILGEDGATVAIWQFSAVHVADQNAVSGAYVLRLGPDEPARLEVAAGPDLDSLLAERPQLRRWRARERRRLFRGFMIWGTAGALVLAALYFSWTRA